MPFAFTLPTTSSLPFTSFASSTTHPSLLLAASTHRGVLRSVLKEYKHLPPSSRASNLTTVLAALDDYLPYLFALDAALCGKTVNGEEVDLTLKEEVVVEWRTTLTARLPGLKAPQVKGKGLDFEICFVLHTLACVYALQARAQLLALYGAITPTAEQRAAKVTTATKQLLQANSTYNYLTSRSVEAEASSAVSECLAQIQGGLAALALAEANLLAVLKDDPYPAVVAQDRNQNDKEWMVKPPEIPKVRAHLFARLCLSAAEHAGKAEAMLSASGRMDEALVRYVNDLQRTSRAKGCRFLGIDAELGGETGRGIAWLTGGKKQLGFAGTKDEGSKMTGLAKLKKDWTERREDKKIEKGGEWGSDAGRLEEFRVIEMLEQKWNKMNDTINTQLIPPSDTLLTSLPSGRDIHSAKLFTTPSLDLDALTRMRAPPDADEMDADDDSGDEEAEKAQASLPGAFPGSSSTTSNDNPYY